MAIINIFKKRKFKKAAKQTASLIRKPAKKLAEKPVEKVYPVSSGRAAISRKEKIATKGEAYQSLKFPHITEKATDLSKQNLYVFKIRPRANKVTVREAIEKLYGVDVVSVGIVKVPPKKRRLGRIEGWRKGYKKAIVKIKEGQKIEVLPR